MKTQFEQLMSGLDDVESFLSGEKEGFKVHVPEKVDVKGIRNKLRMTQARFSDVFGFSLDAIKHWEGGRRTPEAPARTLLTVIDKDPAAVLTALQPRPSLLPPDLPRSMLFGTRPQRRPAGAPIMLQELLSMKIAPIVNTHYDTCRPSSIFASMDAAISVAWLTTSRGKTSASGLALLISSAVSDIKSFSM